MVHNVGLNNGYILTQYSPKDVENIVKFTMGTNIVNSEDSPFAGLGMMTGIGAAIEGGKGAWWLYKNRGDKFKPAWDEFTGKEAEKAKLFDAKGGFKSADAYKVALNEHTARSITDIIPDDEKLSKVSPEAKALYEAARKNSEAAVKTSGEAADKLLKEASESLAKAEALAHSDLSKIKPEGFLSKVTYGFKKYTGINALNGRIKNFAVKSPAVAKLLRYGRGNGAFLMIGGLTELFQIVPAFTQLGIGSGISQIFKSATKTAASTVGWIAGAAVAAKGGAMLGAVLRSASHGKGGVAAKLAESVFSIVGGSVASWFATKGAEKIVGKDEMTKFQERKAQEKTQEIAQNPEEIQTVVAEAAQKLQQEGTDSEDAKVAFKSLQKLAPMSTSATNPFNNNQNFVA